MPQIENTIAIIRNVGGIPYTAEAMAAIDNLVGFPGAVRGCLNTGLLTTNGTKIYA